MKQPPFFFPRDAHGRWRLPAAPTWLQDELRNRVVLLLNHVLQQEPQAMERLRRHAGKTVQLQLVAGALGPLAWPAWQWRLRLSAAGLLQSGGAESDGAAAPTADLRLTIDEPAPLALAQRLTAGQRPKVAIEGDVQLAAEVAWVVDNVRWDIEDDLARLLGDALAHALVQQARALALALRRTVAPVLATAGERAAAWAARRRPGAGTDAAAGAAP